jgi:hypothetical protein
MQDVDSLLSSLTIQTWIHTYKLPFKQASKEGQHGVHVLFLKLCSGRRFPLTTVP